MSGLRFGRAATGATGRRKRRGDGEFPTDPVRAYSVDVDDRRASPGRTIGDGTSGWFWAWRNSILQTARAELDWQREKGWGGDPKLQHTYIAVLEAVFRFLDRKTGDCFASYTAIADAAKCSPSLAKLAIRAWEDLGFIAHVRRSRAKEGCEGQAGPQREAAPNSYYFDCEARMSQRAWAFLRKALSANLARLGRAVKRRVDLIRQMFNSKATPAPRPSDAYRGPEYLHGITDPQLRATLRRMHTKCAEREADPVPSASPK